MQLLILCISYSFLAALVWTRYRRNKLADQVAAGLVLPAEPTSLMWKLGVFLFRVGFCLLLAIFWIKTFWPGFNLLIWDQQELIR